MKFGSSRPTSLRVKGESQLSSAAGDASDFNRFSVLLVRRDGKWKIAEIRESRRARRRCDAVRTPPGARVDGRRLGRRKR